MTLLTVYGSRVQNGGTLRDDGPGDGGGRLRRDLRRGVRV
jgi:hypothetical protein